MTYDEHHFAMPKLYGAPAYARPPRTLVEATPRPLDPDDLPLEAFRDPADDLLVPRAASEAAYAAAPDADAGDRATDESGPPIIRSFGRIIGGR